MNKKTKELNKINNELDSKINKENQEIFTDITLYIRGKSISEYKQEVVRHDITEMIISSQERGEKIEDVIGIDYKEFCDNIIENIEPKTTKEKIIYWFDILCDCFSILLLIRIFFSKETIELIKDIIEGNNPNFNINIPFSIGDIGAIILIIIASITVVMFVVKTIFKIKGKLSKILIVIFYIIIMIALIVFTIYGQKNIMFSVNIFIVLFVALLLFFVHKILERI